MLQRRKILPQWSVVLYRSSEASTSASAFARSTKSAAGFNSTVDWPAAAFWRELEQAGHQLDSIDVGGGLGVCYRAGEDAPVAAADYADAIRRAFDGFRGRIVLEPGRYLVAEAGVLVTRVLRVKRGQEREFLVLDAAMNDLQRPALYDAWHDIVPLHSACIADGLPYFTMPFVEGESLRVRLARHGELPVSEALRLLRAALEDEEEKSAYEIALERTNTAAAPWHVVPSDSKWFRNLVIGHLLLETLRGLDSNFVAAIDQRDAAALERDQ